MLLNFLIASFTLGLLASFFWSKNGGMNVTIKMMFIVYTCWAGLLLAGQMLPLVSSGQIRLI